MSQYNGNGTGSSSLTENKFPPFSELIEEYCDRNPKERTKFICPECGGGNLSVNMKTGKWDCMSEQSADHRQAICNALNGLYKAEHPELSNGSNGRNGGGKPKTARQEFAAKAKAADFDAEMGRSAVEMKVEELSHQFDPSTKRGTLAALTVEIAAWAKAGGHDVFATKMMLKEAIERVVGDGVLAIKKPSVNTTGQEVLTHSNDDMVSVSASVESVSRILSDKLAAFMEQHELELLQSRSEMTKGGFWSLVSELRGKDEVEDEIEIENLVKFAEWKAAVFDLKDVLPGGLARSMISDAKSLGIEPMMLWQYLFVAVLSLLPKDAGLMMHSHLTPAIAYTAIIAETGAGKTRAENLIMKPLVKLQIEASALRKSQVDQYNRDVKAATKNQEDAEEIPKPPSEEKYVLTVATIQAVWSKLSEQTEHGTVWTRDELAGLFKSFGQFSKGGDNESLELILQSWDGATQFIDRMDEARSFVLENPRLLIAGGLQPAVYRQIFKDPEDSQGLAARFCMFHGKPTPVKDIGRKTQLSESLPSIYQAIQDLKLGIVEPTEETYKLWNDERYTAEMEAKDHPIASVKAWLRKFSGHVSRIALALHAIECIYDTKKDKAVLTEETMTKALKFAHFYRQQFEIIQAQSVEPSNLSGYLIKIWDMANNKNNGVTCRDVLRNFPALNKTAKDAKRKSSDIVLDLFAQLSERGKGRVEETGKTRKFFSSFGITPEPIDRFDTSDTSTPVTVLAVNTSCPVVLTLDKTEQNDTPIKVGDTVEILDGSLKGQQPTVTAIKEVDGETTYILSGRHTSKIKGSINFDNHELPASRIRLLSSNGKS